MQTARRSWPEWSKFVLASVVTLLWGCQQGDPTAAISAANVVSQRSGLDERSVSPREQLIQRLLRLSEEGEALVGQQHAILWGMYANGSVRSTYSWFQETAERRAWTSDAASLVGDDPALMGVSLEMLAFEPRAWNRRDVVGAAMRHYVEQQGPVTLEWHAARCDYPVDGSLETLGQVEVEGTAVPIYGIPGGTSFYVDSGYRRDVRSVADVPENVQCLCKIANDRVIENGLYRGRSARDWLVAHATYAGQVLREQGLSDAPLIMRPFHEFTGNWFWWGQPYWNCRALLQDESAVSGPEAYQAVYRLFAETLREASGNDNLLFAYSTDKLSNVGYDPGKEGAETKVYDPEPLAHDLLWARLNTQMRELGLLYESPAQRLIHDPPADTPIEALQAYYLEAYPGDDLIDLLGVDIYFWLHRVANEADMQNARAYLGAVREVAEAKGKPFALTETGEYRMHLLYRLQQRAATHQDQLLLFPAERTRSGYSWLFAEEDRRKFLSDYGFDAPGPVTLTAAEVEELFSPEVVRRTSEWFNEAALALVEEFHPAYLLFWQTYYAGEPLDRSYTYYQVPFPGHPAADAFRRFAAAPSTCFLRERCGVTAGGSLP